MINRLIPIVLFVTYIVVFIALGIHPYARDVWYAENIPIVAIVVTLVVMYIRGVRLSALSYMLMSVLIFIHTVGGHYTFERVPFDWFNNLFGFERNMYDRVGHFSVGLYAFGFLELIDRYKIINRRWVAYLFPLFAIGFVAMSYELIEWIYADTAGGQAGIAFLGSQGDVWDAQKDMLLDTLGACASLVLYFIIRERKVNIDRLA
jgi:putative membrane protein